MLTSLIYADVRFSSRKACFSVKFNEEIIPYDIMGVFVLPGEKITLQALDKDKNQTFVLRARKGTIVHKAKNRWQWLAPSEKGLYPITIIHPQSPDSIILNVFVMVPYKELQGEYLNGYRIGKYPSASLKKLSIYEPPKGFIEVTREMEETYIAPHFKLKQFLCKQNGDYPKYVVLKERLLLKLELILTKLNDTGYHCNTLHIMSGYRTPFYNKAIGNVKYSYHLWGGAADIFIDEDPKDGNMDDLNKDGTIDYRDATILYEIIDRMYEQSWYKIFIGGLGRYKKTHNHGPFVHVDVRGFRARWGR